MLEMSLSHIESESGPPRLDAALAVLHSPSAKATYLEQDRLVHFDRLLPPGLLAPLLEDLERVRPAVRRKSLPRYKSSGSVSHHTLQDHAPSIIALHRSPVLLAALSALAGVELQPCPESDPHGAAIYFYTEPGDRIGWHYDSSHYKGARYTVLIGLVERSSSRLICRLHERDPARRGQRELRLATEPGTLVFFDGDALYHSVSALGVDEERVALTLVYVTDPGMSPLRRVVSNVKDATAYFGFKEMFKNRDRL